MQLSGKNCSIGLECDIKVETRKGKARGWLDGIHETKTFKPGMLSSGHTHTIYFVFSFGILHLSTENNESVSSWLVPPCCVPHRHCGPSVRSHCSFIYCRSLASKLLGISKYIKQLLHSPISPKK